MHSCNNANNKGLRQSFRLENNRKMNVIILDGSEIALVRRRRACQEGFIYGETASGSLPYSGVCLMTRSICRFDVTLLAALLSLIQTLFLKHEHFDFRLALSCTPEVLFLFPFAFYSFLHVTLLKPSELLPSARLSSVSLQRLKSALLV